MSIAAVIIGRNEGGRLLRCLASLKNRTELLVYVDSGSTDSSVKAARAAGAEVIQLDPSVPFTAARARNAGMGKVSAVAPATDFVQFVDGDCEVRPGWIPTAHAFLRDHPEAAVACGRRRERFPEASIYNRLIDSEWDTPVGRTKACGGDALVRVEALAQVGGYDPILIAGEEPELCVRLRAVGWEVWRLDEEMTLHDAALTRFGQWWQRTRRGGYAYAEAVAMHGGEPEHHGVPELRRIFVWGIALPVVALFGALFLDPGLSLLLLAYPAQVLRLRFRGESWLRSVFLTLSKLAEAQGVLSYLSRFLTGARAPLIEYK